MAKKPIKVYMDPRTIDALRAESERTGESISALVNRALSIVYTSMYIQVDSDTCISERALSGPVCISERARIHFATGPDCYTNGSVKVNDPSPTPSPSPGAPGPRPIVTTSRNIATSSATTDPSSSSSFSFSTRPDLTPDLYIQPESAENGKGPVGVPNYHAAPRRGLVRSGQVGGEKRSQEGEGSSASGSNIAAVARDVIAHMVRLASSRDKTKRWPPEAYEDHLTRLIDDGHTIQTIKAVLTYQWDTNPNYFHPKIRLRPRNFARDRRHYEKSIAKPTTEQSDKSDYYRQT